MKVKRGKMDITLDELSEMTGVSISFLCQIENGKDNCPKYLTNKIAAILRCEPDTLFKTVIKRKVYYMARKGR